MIEKIYNEGAMCTTAVPKSKNGITKCKYCGREFMHSNGTSVVVLFSIDSWNRKLTTSVHDARLPLNCPSCGADVYLNSNTKETKRYNIKGTEGTGPC